MTRETLRGKPFGWYIVRTFKSQDGKQHFFYLGKTEEGCYIGFTPLANFCRAYVSQRNFVKLVNDEGLSCHQAMQMYGKSEKAKKYF